MRDLDTELLQAPAFTGAFVKRARVARKDSLATELVPGSNPALMKLVASVALNNGAVALVWDDRVVWWSWFDVLHPTGGAFTKDSLSVRAGESYLGVCDTPLETIAERVRAAALIEAARKI